MSRIIKAFSLGQPFDEAAPAFTIKVKPPVESDEFCAIGETPDVVVEELTPLEIITKAKEQASQIIEDARTKSIAYIKEKSEKVDAEVAANVKLGFDQGFENGVLEGIDVGKKRGYDQGYAEGTSVADELSRKTITFMQSVIEGIDEGKHMMLKKYENELSDVALSIAKLVIKREVKVNPSTLKSIIENATVACKNQDYILVTLSPHGYQIITNDDPEIVALLKTYSDDVRFFADKNMADTDCVIETPLGVIDASVAVQFKNIEAAIKSHDNQDN